MSTSTTTPIQSHCSSGISNSHSITAGTISYHVKGQTNGDMGRWREKDTNLDQKKGIFSDRPVATSLRLRYCPVLGSLLRLLPTLSSPCSRNPHMSRNMLLLDERSGAVGESARCGETRERDTCYL